jgi:hypothetical protein
MVFLGVHEPFTKAPENPHKTKNGKGNYNQPGYPHKGTFHTIVAIPVLNALNGQPCGAADQIEVLEDAGHVVYAEPGEVKKLLDIDVPLQEGVHRQQEIPLPFHDVRLGKQLTSGRDCQLF